MVNVTHNADYRRSGNHISLILFLFFQKLSDHVYLFFRLCDNIIAQSNFLCLFKVDLMVYCYHGSFHKELFHNYRRLHFHFFSQLTDCHFFRKCNFLHFFLLFFLRMRYRLLKLHCFRNFLCLTASALIWTFSLILIFISAVVFFLVFSVCLTAVFFYKLQLWSIKFRGLFTSAVISSSIVSAAKTSVSTFSLIISKTVSGAFSVSIVIIETIALTIFSVSVKTVI